MISVGSIVLTMTLGEISIALSVIACGMAIYYGVKFDVRILQSDIKGIKAAIEQLPGAMTAIALQGQRMSNIEDDIRDLRYGRGFVVEPPTDFHPKRGG